MDCIDVVAGGARGNLFRILDYYTRDRSTPRTDDFYGGDDDLTAAVGGERQGVTILRFRRPLSGMLKEREEGEKTTLDFKHVPSQTQMFFTLRTVFAYINQTFIEDFHALF